MHYLHIRASKLLIISIRGLYKNIIRSPYFVCGMPASTTCTNSEYFENRIYSLYTNIVFDTQKVYYVKKSSGASHDFSNVRLIDVGVRISQPYNNLFLTVFSS